MDNSDPHAFPPLLPPDQMPDIVDQVTLDHTWRALMGQVGFAEPQLWVLFIARNRPLHVAKVEGVPLHPDADDVERLGDFLHDVVGDGVEFAFLFARPGGSMRTPGDLAWARGLSTLATKWPIHLANDVELRVVAPDDLAA